MAIQLKSFRRRCTESKGYRQTSRSCFQSGMGLDSIKPVMDHSFKTFNPFPSQKGTDRFNAFSPASTPHSLNLRTGQPGKTGVHI